MWCSFALPRHRKKSEVMPGFVCIHSYWNENIYSQHERWHSGQVPKFSSGFLFFIYVHVWTLMIKCYCQLCHHVRAIMSNCPSYSFSLRQKRGITGKHRNLTITPSCDLIHSPTTPNNAAVQHLVLKLLHFISFLFISCSTTKMEGNLRKIIHVLDM